MSIDLRGASRHLDAFLRFMFPNVKKRNSHLVPERCVRWPSVLWHVVLPELALLVADVLLVALLYFDWAWRAGLAPSAPCL